MALYAGDVDMACNFLGGEMFAEAMDLSLMSEYQAWNYMAADGTKQIGGYLKKFDRLSWVTVKGPVHDIRHDRFQAIIRCNTSILDDFTDIEP